VQRNENLVDVVEVDFEIISEGWSRCKLKDGSIVRFRIPVIKVFESTNRGPLGYPNIGIVQGPVLASVLEPNERGPSSIADVKPEQFTEEVAIIERNENEQVYRTKDGFRLRLKPVLVKVFKARGVFNQFGEPVYQVHTQAIFDVDKI
jgi:hypothetical protein